MRLRNKVAVVTGAARGIGFASAERFVREGATVVLADIDGERGEAAAETIRASGGEALFVAADVGDSAAVEALVEGTVDRFGGRLGLNYTVSVPD